MGAKNSAMKAERMMENEMMVEETATP